jgi:hypothetical protein
MRTRTLLTAFAAAAALTVLSSVSAQAQDTTRKSSAGDVVKPAQLSTIIASLDSTAVQLARLNAITNLSVTNLKVVNVADVAVPNDSLLSAALERNKVAVEDLRKALEANATVKEFLSKNTPALAAGDVVAINVTPTGSVELYVRKPA